MYITLISYKFLQVLLKLLRSKLRNELHQRTKKLNSMLLSWWKISKKIMIQCFIFVSITNLSLKRISRNQSSKLLEHPRKWDMYHLQWLVSLTSKSRYEVFFFYLSNEYNTFRKYLDGLQMVDEHLVLADFFLRMNDNSTCMECVFFVVFFWQFWFCTYIN